MGEFSKRFGIHTVTIGFTTFEGEHRLQQLRGWVAEELKSTKEPASIAEMFLFATLPEAVTPQQVWLDPCWYLATETQAFSLLSL